MIYPERFEEKIGMLKIREKVCNYCLYDPGKEYVRNLPFSDAHEAVVKHLQQVDEFKNILSGEEDFPIGHFIDINPILKKARVRGRFLEEQEVFDLKRTLESVRAIVSYMKSDEEDKYPALKELAKDVKVFPVVTDRINSILNRHGHIRDNASRELQTIRKTLQEKQAAISKKLHQILNRARQNGLVDEDTTLSIRNGRPVIPVPAMNKRKIEGYVHEESATGKTAFIEPSVVVEANNELRELENEERREIIRILTEFTDFIRPYINELQLSHFFLTRIDSIRARARFAMEIGGIFPAFRKDPELDWLHAIHPLLLLSFRHLGKEEEVVPLDIKLDAAKRILLISGPNAGGKSVCLQTVGLLQYMLQCGFLVPVGDRSVFGCFHHVFLDMGDEQSIENDLSTYSSHLVNMKYFLRNSDDQSLVLIDEFGSGTEPMLGGAIAEAVLERLNETGVFGVITTHYTNLKHFAASADRIVNGAMLFDTHKMQPVFKLAVGKPGSSFAFEIANKIGLPQDILQAARDKVGQEHVDFEKHLKDIIRDKKYWENKRQRIRVAEKRLAELVARYDTELSDTEKLRKKIVHEAKEKAEQMLSAANARIENTIREIKEAEAEKQKTKEARKKLDEFRDKVGKEDSDTREAEQDALRKKLDEVRKRGERIRHRQPETRKKEEVKPGDEMIRQGDHVLMKGQQTAGEVLELKGRKAAVAFGALRTLVDTDKLEKIPEERYQRMNTSSTRKSQMGEWDIGKKRLHFKPEIDVRGKRADEAMQIITEFIDEATMVQAHELRILHGKGNGILREYIRQFLDSMEVVSWYGDEHVERGGAGITVVKLES